MRDVLDAQVIATR